MTDRRYPLWLNICSGVSLALIPVGFVCIFLDVEFAVLVMFFGFFGVSIFGNAAHYIDENKANDNS